MTGKFSYVLFVINVILKSSTVMANGKQHSNYIHVYMFSVLVKRAEYNSKSLIFAR